MSARSEFSVRPVFAISVSLIALLISSACADRELAPDGSDGERADSGFEDAELADGSRDGSGDAEAIEPFVATMLDEVTSDAGVHSVHYRLQRGAGAASYAQWYPPSADGGIAPVVVLTQPYEGIHWTGEAVDAKWAARGPGQFPDEDEPSYDPSIGSTITYDPMTVEEADESTFLWRYHGFGVLLLFGRFYAGGDVQNDIDDMTMGFDFLAQRSDVDPTRVGIMGGSWGGFEALYGAAYATSVVKPSVGVALYPVSDFEAEEDYVTNILPSRYTEASSRASAAAFFEPYLRRINATRDRNSGFSGLRAEDLVTRIQAPFLIVHEDWDTLVSFEQSQRLVSLAPDRFLPLWILHDGQPQPWDQVVNNHGPLLGEFAGLGAYPIVFAHLLTHLGSREQPLFVLWDPPSFRALLGLMRDRQAEGTDIGFLAPQLALLCDARVQTFDVVSQTLAPGAQTIASEMSATWNVQLDAQGACLDLEQGRLPSP